MTKKKVDLPRPCEHCDGLDGPAVARVRMRDWDGSSFTVNVCKQCKKDNADEIIRVMKEFNYS